MFVLALDFSFIFVVVSIFALGLESTELLQRHFGALPSRIPSLYFISRRCVPCVIFLRSIPDFSRQIALNARAGIIGFIAIHQMGLNLQSISTPRS